jgi:alkylation response protein AidB-like acyl-CoA dehydrogenase
VDFELTADQQALQEGIRSLLAGRFPPEVVRGLEGTPGAIRRDLWRSLWDAGVFTARLPEPAGIGLGMADAVLVFEELGRALVPGPLVGTHLAAGVVEGETVGMVEGPLRPGSMVEHAEALDALVVIDDGGASVVDPRDLEGELVERPLDPLVPVHRLHTAPAGERIAGPDQVDRWRLEGACLTAALQLGIAARLCEMATAYAKEREQFGRPIGAFQAVKHLCADMLVRVEIARAAVYAAGATLDAPDAGDPRRAVAVAKVVAGEAAVVNGEAAIQVHGGIGFTWELDAHRYWKRAWVLDSHFGSGERHAEVIAATL